MKKHSQELNYTQILDWSPCEMNLMLVMVCLCFYSFVLNKSLMFWFVFWVYEFFFLSFSFYTAKKKFFLIIFFRVLKIFILEIFLKSENVKREKMEVKLGDNLWYFIGLLGKKMIFFILVILEFQKKIKILFFFKILNQKY